MKTLIASLTTRVEECLRGTRIDVEHYGNWLLFAEIRKMNIGKANDENRIAEKDRSSAG
jgi:hypothetical protein